MAKLLGGIFAFVALAVCILNGIEPWTTTVRGLVAFVVGHFAGALWESFFGQPGGRVIQAEELTNQGETFEGHTELEYPSSEEPAA